MCKDDVLGEMAEKVEMKILYHILIESTLGSSIYSYNLEKTLQTNNVLWKDTSV